MNTISMSALGKRGRWGNQCFQFAFLRGYAAAKNLNLCLPEDWIGRQLFRVPEMGTAGIVARRIDLDEALVLGQWDQWINQLAGFDFVTYAQHQKYLDFYTRAQCREWFALQPPWDEYERKLIAEMPPHYIACHLRRDDYIRHPFNQHYATVHDGSYEEALNKIPVDRAMNILWVEQGWREPSQVVKDAGIPWLDDFLILKNAAHLLRANSSFSYWAGVLGNGQVYSPIVEDRIGWQNAEFVEGNWPRTSGHKNQSDLHLREA